MLTNRLKLYKPNIDIYFKTTINALTDNLTPYGFKLTKIDDKESIIHGEAWINKEDKVVIHFYFNDVGKLISVMIHSIKKSNEDTIINSYYRKQQWIEKLYGKPNNSIENSMYNINDYIWKLDECTIKHFIKDRFGDEEGIYFDII